MSRLRQSRAPDEAGRRRTFGSTPRSSSRIGSRAMAWPHLWTQVGQRLWTGLSEAGAYLAMEYGMAASLPPPAVRRAAHRPGESA